MKFGRFEFKRVENTKWDYIVPVSLVLLQLLVFNYALSNTTICSHYITPDGMGYGEDCKTHNLLNYGKLVFNFIFLGLVILSISFFTRKKRVFVPLALLIIALITFIPFEFLNIEGPPDFIFAVIVLIFISALLLLEYLMANITLLVKFGSVVQKKELKISLTRSITAWASYGFGLDMLSIYATAPYSAEGVTSVNSIYIFEGLYRVIGIQPLVPIFTIVFAMFGFATEKYKRRRSSK